MAKKMTFALAFCNRGFMPGELIYGARDGIMKAVTDAGCNYIAMDASPTRYGGIEARDEGLLYAKWLKEHKGEYDGVIFPMPIFADENGAITALQDAGVPILMQAYPDEIGKMDFAAICRVVNGMKRFSLGCIGARTTAFKTTRFDEVAMQKHGINVESFDLSQLFYRVQNMDGNDSKVLAKREHLENYSDFSLSPLRATLRSTT